MFSVRAAAAGYMISAVLAAADAEEAEKITDANIDDAVVLWIVDEEAATARFGGPIAEWDVGRVTVMDSLFSGKKTFNADLSKWRGGGRRPRASPPGGHALQWKRGRRLIGTQVSARCCSG